MSTIEEELLEDAKFLRMVANTAEGSSFEHVKLDPEATKKLKDIADKLGNVSAVMFSPRITLEKKAEKVAAEWIETCLNTEFEEHEEIHLFLWLLQLRLQQSASKAMVGSLGAGLIAMMAGGAGKGKAPLDPDDMP